MGSQGNPRSIGYSPMPRLSPRQACGLYHDTIAIIPQAKLPALNAVPIHPASGASIRRPTISKTANAPSGNNAARIRNATGPGMGVSVEGGQWSVVRGSVQIRGDAICFYWRVPKGSTNALGGSERFSL